MTETEDLLNFFRANDDYAKKIARRGRKFIKEHLRMDDVTAYWRELLTRYAKLLRWKPVKSQSLTLIGK